jgi:hypothetical protein
MEEKPAPFTRTVKSAAPGMGRPAALQFIFDFSEYSLFIRHIRAEFTQLRVDRIFSLSYLPG